MTLLRREFLMLAGASALGSPSVLAAAYPARPVRVLVPYAPSGPTDILARLAAQKLSEQLGKPFYVENVGGAGGNI
jgi:tripartite-type tricarboxylate transporter receptor subunit TctC